MEPTTHSNTIALQCGHAAPARMFGLTPAQSFHNCTMGYSSHDIMVTCPTCRRLVGRA